MDNSQVKLIVDTLTALSTELKELNRLVHSIAESQAKIAQEKPPEKRRPRP